MTGAAAYTVHRVEQAESIDKDGRSWSAVNVTYRKMGWIKGDHLGVGLPKEFTVHTFAADAPRVGSCTRIGTLEPPVKSVATDEDGCLPGCGRFGSCPRCR